MSPKGGFTNLGGATTNFFLSTQPVLLDDQVIVPPDVLLVCVLREQGEQGDLLVHQEVPEPDLQEGEGRLAIDGLPFSLDVRRGIVQGEPEVHGLQFLRNAPHRPVFTFQPLEPALDGPGNLDVVDAREVAELPLVDQGRNTQVGTA